MRVGLTIGGLGTGGAEAQLMRLATSLRHRGCEVQVFCYAAASALDDQLRDDGIQVFTTALAGRRAKIRAMRAWMHAFQPDIVHASMKRASVLAIMARGLRCKCKVLASDLSTATYSRRNPALWAALLAFGFADRVVTQTELNRRSLERLAPWLRGKTHVIRNGLDIERFRPAERGQANAPFRFAVVGSVYRVKNPATVVRAVAELRGRGCEGFRVDWYGRFGLAADGTPSDEYQQACRYIEQNGLSEWFCFRGETRDILGAYQTSDALIHVSLQEGFPNAVVEAMACGLPIIASPVSDLPQVVAIADNGRIVETTDAVGLADAMEWLMQLGVEQRRDMGVRSRELAISWFGLNRFADEYISLYKAMLAGRRVAD